MAKIVQFVAPGEVLPRLLVHSRALVEGPHVTVLALHTLQQIGGLVEECLGLGVRSAPTDLVCESLERLVDIGVEEGVPASVLAATRLEHGTQVVEIAGFA